MSAADAEHGTAPPVWVSRLADAIIITTISCCVALLGRAVVRFNPTVGVDQLVTFYVLPALVAIGLGSTFRFARESRVNLALLLVTLGVSLLVSEAVLLTVLERNAGEPLTASPQSPEHTTIYDRVMALRSTGTRAYPRVPGSVLVERGLDFAVDDRVVYPLTPAPGGVPVVLCNEGGEAVVYEADRFGFDNPDAIWDSEQLDVVLIGDSYTHGVCVGPEHRIAAHLRARWRTLNLGVSGAGPLQELAILREYAAQKAPPIVVWIYYEGNDLSELNGETGRPWLVAYLDSDHEQGLRALRGDIDSKYALWLDSLLARGPGPLTGDVGSPGAKEFLFQVAHVRALRRLMGFGVSFPRADPPLGSLPTVLRRAVKDVASWGGHLLLVYMPSFTRYDVWAGRDQQGRPELLSFARDEGIPLVDLDEAFQATADPRDLWAHPRGHLSPRGYRLAASAIAAAIDSISTSASGGSNAPASLGASR